jgi:hypothetical protein
VWEIPTSSRSQEQCSDEWCEIPGSQGKEVTAGCLTADGKPWCWVSSEGAITRKVSHGYFLKLKYFINTIVDNFESSYTNQYTYLPNVQTNTEGLLLKFENY